MTLSHVSSRLGAFAAAALVATTLIVAPQAEAASKANYYKVELSQAPAAPKKIIRGVFFNCEGTSCSAPLASSAPRNVCVTVARELGAISSFKAGSRDFDAAEVASCNEAVSSSLAKN